VVAERLRTGVVSDVLQRNAQKGERVPERPRALIEHAVALLVFNDLRPIPVRCDPPYDLPLRRARAAARPSMERVPGENDVGALR
jgi:hypothetical protein